MKKITLLLTMSALMCAVTLQAQVAINQDGSNASSSSILDVKDASDNPAFFIETTGDVGVGTTNPTESLDVVGNVKFSGALMPNNDAGTSGQLLISEGPGTAATWGAEMLNRSQTTAIGKFYSGSINIPGGYYYNPGILILTLSDPNCVETSTCYITWTGPLPTGVEYGELTYTVEAQTGQWIFHFANRTGYNLNNFEFSFVAFY